MKNGHLFIHVSCGVNTALQQMKLTKHVKYSFQVEKNKNDEHYMSYRRF